MTESTAPASPAGGPQSIRYQRARFSTRLDTDCLYTAAHMWLRRDEHGFWRVGYTRFATRMLGEAVELDFETNAGDPVSRGQEIGWIEGLKAVSDIYSPISGVFRGPNEALLNDIALLSREPRDGGWLFAVEGEPDGDCLDVQGYCAILDRAIDKILGNNIPS